MENKDQQGKRVAALEALLNEANDLLRSVFQIGSRNGLETNWPGLQARVDRALKRQHLFMYPKEHKDGICKSGCTAHDEERSAPQASAKQTCVRCQGRGFRTAPPGGSMRCEDCEGFGWIRAGGAAQGEEK